MLKVVVDHRLSHLLSVKTPTFKIATSSLLDVRFSW